MRQPKDIVLHRDRLGKRKTLCERAAGDKKESVIRYFESDIVHNGRQVLLKVNIIFLFFVVFGGAVYFKNIIPV